MKNKAPVTKKQDNSNYLVPIVIMLVISTLLAIAVPGFTKARERANQRACYANQKTLAGAIEMYELDHPGKNIKMIDMDLLVELKQKGYLTNLLEDPGAGPNSELNYELVGKTMFCLRHGSIQGIKGHGSRPPRDELIAAGIKDQKLIKRASETFAPEPNSARNLFYKGVPFYFFLSLFLLLLEIVRLVVRKVRSVHHYVTTGKE